MLFRSINEVISKVVGEDMMKSVQKIDMSSTESESFSRFNWIIYGMVVKMRGFVREHSEIKVDITMFNKVRK